MEHGDGSCVAFYFVYATQEPSPYSTPCSILICRISGIIEFMKSLQEVGVITVASVYFSCLFHIKKILTSQSKGILRNTE